MSLTAGLALYPMPPLSLLRLAESLLVGSATGVLSGLLGIGGGFILVPLLTLIGTPIHTAVGTSLAFISCVSLAGLVQHTRQGSIDYLAALAITLPAAVSASIGAHFSSLLTPVMLYLSFSMLTLVVLVFFYFSPLPPEPTTARAAVSPARPFYVRPRQRYLVGTCYRYEVHVPKALAGGLATGLVSGLFGVGGGFLLVPLSVIVLKIPMPVAVGTCLGVTVPPAMVGAFAHWQLGHVNVGLWWPLVLGGVFGSQLGARYAVRLSPELLKRLFLLLVLGAVLYMLARGLSA